VFFATATYLSSMSDDDRSADSISDHTDWQRVWHHLHASLGNKWTFHVLRLLSERDAGFNEMKHELDGITAKTLSQRLRELRCRGFVQRHVKATTPPSTRYTLTEQGRTFVATLRELESFVDVVDCSECADDACAVVTVDDESTAVASTECC
jgi:DNA-binding HxlR family transcriptional regulator